MQGAGGHLRDPRAEAARRDGGGVDGAVHPRHSWGDARPIFLPETMVASFPLSRRIGAVLRAPRGVHGLWEEPIDGVTRFEAEILGAGYPWTAKSVPRVNAFTEDFGYYCLGQRMVDAGVPPGWFGYRFMGKESAEEYAARQVDFTGVAAEVLHPRARFRNALPRNITSRDELPDDSGWWGYSMRDAPHRESSSTLRLTLPVLAPECRLRGRGSPSGERFDRRSAHGRAGAGTIHLMCAPIKIRRRSDRFVPVSPVW